MGKGRPKPRKTGPQPYTYYLRIFSWHVRCNNSYEWKVTKVRYPTLCGPSEIREATVEHRHYIDTKVELLNPVKNVVSGSLDIVSSREVKTRTASYPENIENEQRPQDEGGGSLWSRWADDREQKTFNGLVSVDECAFLALLQVLTTGLPVIIDLNGEEFYRNTARIRSVGWFTEGDHDLQDEVKYAIEESRTRKRP